jgi:superfamily II DNA or RNA helicase
MNTPPPSSRHDLTPGSLVMIRGEVWRLQAVEMDNREACLTCVGVDGITKDQIAVFSAALENVVQIDPTEIELLVDKSSGFEDAKLHLEAAFRSSPPAGAAPLVLGKAAIDDLLFQHVPVERALSQPRARLLIGDDVGLGKTLEAGLVASELALRRRARRILVVSTRAMLAQFQKEFWTRFSIPLARLDASAIKRMRARIPAHYNVFDQFERAIVSIDTLKRDLGIRTALEQCHWDLVIIDEAHNAAVRGKNSSGSSLRARLARLLSRRADSLLLLTATPHDGSQASFSSLVQMLDPTRIPNAEEVTREDIADLVIRRFRTTPAVKADLQTHVPQRALIPRSFPLTAEEDEAYRMIAEMQLDMDGVRGKALQLFRTTLAKAMFSSPMACLETVGARIRTITRTGRGTEQDIASLEALGSQLQNINGSNFAKYQDLLQHLREQRWSPKDPRDRIVIFSERLKTLSWLEEHLKRDLGLRDDQIGRVDGAAAESDERMQKLLEDFGQKPAPVRILLASDMASEGLNLHFHCRRLVHFDLPWSLIRFQQRNGRIDRYGQDRQPLVTYFIGESSHPKVRDMWVLDRLVARDEAAQQGVGDPAVFLGTGDPDAEEEVVADVIAGGGGGASLDALMDANAAGKDDRAGASGDLDALLFGEYDDTTDAAHDAPRLGDAQRPPRLFADTFSYVATAMTRLARPDVGLLKAAPKVNSTDRVIRLPLPDTMKAGESFGYSAATEVDERYMPREALTGGEIALTDRSRTINAAIDAAKFDERAWPDIQYLWDVHPIMDWVNDGVRQLFGRRQAPLVRVPSGLETGECAVLMHSSVTNRRGAPLVDAWGVVRVLREDALNVRVGAVEDAEVFLNGLGFAGPMPNQGGGSPEAARDVLAPAVDRFQEHFYALQKARQAELGAVRDQHMERLERLRGRFEHQLTLDFGDAQDAPKNAQERRAQNRRARRAADVEQMFSDWEEWFAETSDLMTDPKAFVDIVAVFQG